MCVCVCVCVCECFVCVCVCVCANVCIYGIIFIFAVVALQGSISQQFQTALYIATNTTYYFYVVWISGVCMYVRMCIQTYVRMYIHTYIRTFVCTYVCRFDESYTRWILVLSVCVQYEVQPR